MDGAGRLGIGAYLYGDLCWLLVSCRGARSRDLDQAARIRKVVAEGDWKAHEEVVGEMRVLHGLLNSFFPMDKIPSLNRDCVGSAQRGFRSLKVDADFLLSNLSEIDSPIHIEDLKEVLKKSNIDLVVENIESEQPVIDLLNPGLELA